MFLIFIQKRTRFFDAVSADSDDGDEQLRQLITN